MTNISEKLEARYGVTMTMEQVGEVLHMGTRSILNAISAGRFPIATFVICRKRLAYTDEVAGHLEKSKVLRHGFERTHPDGGPTNREALERECGDVYHAIWRLIGAGDIDGNGMSQRADDKAKSVVRYLHHQGHNA